MAISKIGEVAGFINQLADEMHQASVVAGWWGDKRDIYVICTKLALCHSELSEALEGFRKGLVDDHLPNRSMAEVELADAVIRIFDLAASQGFDLGGAIVEKLAYNTQRADHKKEAREGFGGKRV